MVLEKTRESPLDCKEIQPVHPKGNQPWIFIGKTYCFLICGLGLSQLYFQGANVLISWLQSPSAVVLEPKKLKSVTVSIVPPSICHEVMGPDAMIFVFWMLSFKPVFSLSSFTFFKRLFSSSLLYAIRVVLPAYLRLLIFLLVILISGFCVIQPGITHNVLCIWVK